MTYPLSSSHHCSLVLPAPSIIAFSPLLSPCTSFAPFFPARLVIPRFFPFFFFPYSIRLRLSALLHPPSKYLWSRPSAVLGSLARALRSQRYADWLVFFFLLFFCKAVFEQEGRWVNLIKARRGREEEKKVAGMTRAPALMPVCVQTSEEDASCRCRRTLLIFSSGKHGAHQEVEKQQRWRLHSQDWNWSWRKEKIK